MAQKKTTKSDAVRAALKKTESPSEVTALLKKQGIKVSAQFVSTIKSADKKKSDSNTPRRGPGRPPGSAGKAKANGHAATVDLKTTSEMLSDAMDLVLRCGGESEAKQLVSTAAKLIAKVR